MIGLLWIACPTTASGKLAIPGGDGYTTGVEAVQQRGQVRPPSSFGAWKPGLANVLALYAMHQGIALLEWIFSPQRDAVNILINELRPEGYPLGTSSQGIYPRPAPPPDWST